jgi:hypothetical protein
MKALEEAEAEAEAETESVQVGEGAGPAPANDLSLEELIRAIAAKGFEVTIQARQSKAS